MSLATKKLFLLGMSLFFVHLSNHASSDQGLYCNPYDPTSLPMNDPRSAFLDNAPVIEAMGLLIGLRKNANAQEIEFFSSLLASTPSMQGPDLSPSSQMLELLQVMQPLKEAIVSFNSVYGYYPSNLIVASVAKTCDEIETFSIIDYVDFG